MYEVLRNLQSPPQAVLIATGQDRPQLGYGVVDPRSLDSPLYLALPRKRILQRLVARVPAAPRRAAAIVLLAEA